MATRTEAFTKLIQLVKSAFVSKTDVEQCSEVSIDTTPTADSGNLITSGGVASAVSTLNSSITSLDSAVIKGVKSPDGEYTKDSESKITIPYATNSAVGVSRPSSTYFAEMGNGGVFRARGETYAVYSAGHGNGFIGKTTLENICSARGWIQNIKTTIDSVMTVNTSYYLGEQSTLSLSMPTTVSTGQVIIVCFSSGSTACTLTCDLTGFSFVPKANKTNLIKFTYIGSDNWIVETKES